jgi:hypothetical protein
MEPTAAQVACFEAGIKFGALYHQFAGTPVSPESADSLARAIEEAIENQPYCERVSVDVDEAAVAADATRGYAEFTGRHATAEVVVEYGGVEVVARMAMDEGYPLMEVVSVESAA